MIHLDRTSCVVIYEPVMEFDRIFQEIYCDEWLPKYQAHLFRGTRKALGTVALGNPGGAMEEMKKVLWNFTELIDQYTTETLTLWKEFEQAMRMSREFTPYGLRRANVLRVLEWHGCLGCWVHPA